MILNFLGFQDSATPIMEGIIDLHNYIFMYLILIFIFVLVIFGNILVEYFYQYNYPYSIRNVFARFILFTGNKVTHGTLLELIWTIIPSIVLIFIAVPSFVLIYAMDEVVQPTLTLKAIGHQWYWSYEYANISESNFKEISMDSNMVFDDELNFGELRLLQVDKVFMLPIETHINVIVTSHDVLHSWAVPSLGIKIDAVPGRLNQVSLFLKREGVFYGQCSELCGVNHGFMPVMVKALSFETWNNWIEQNTM